MGIKRSFGGIAVAAVLAASAAGAASALPADETRTRAPLADAFVSAAAPRADTRRERVLLVSSRPVRRAYITFAQPADPRTIVSATLELHVRQGGAGLGVARTASPWLGGRLAFATAPKPVQPVLRQGRLAAGTRLRVDVTSLARTQGRVTFALSSTSSRLALWSAQAGAALAPTLTVVTRTGVEVEPPPEDPPIPIPPPPP